MTSSAPPPEQPASPPPAAPPPAAPATPYAPVPGPVERPGMVTGAGIAMIVIGILITLAGLLALFVGAIIGGASNAFDVQAPGFGSIAGAAAAVVIVFSIIVLAIGILDIIAAINVFSGRSWARWTGIVVAGLLILFSLGSLGSGDSGGVIVGLVWIAANAFVIYALAVAGSWFALRGT